MTYVGILGLGIIFAGIRLHARPPVPPLVSSFKDDTQASGFDG